MSVLIITNNTICLGSSIYQVRNITSVGKYRLKPQYLFGLVPIMFFAFLGLMGIYWTKGYLDTSLTRGIRHFFGGMIAIAILGSLERLIKPKRYGITLETNAGSSRIVTSRDEALIDEIISKIIEVLNSEDESIGYNFNIDVDDKYIVNQRGFFENGVRLDK